MDEFYYDLTLLFFGKICSCVTYDTNFLLLIFARVVLNFFIDLAEFLLLEFGSGEPEGNVKIARYVVLAFLAFHIVCSHALLLTLLKYRHNMDDLEDGVRIFRLLLFKILCFAVDGSILMYTIFIAGDFETAIPFFKKPNGDVNWIIWSLSLICFLDMLCELGEIVLTIIQLCGKHNKVAPPPYKVSYHNLNMFLFFLHRCFYLHVIQEGVLNAESTLHYMLFSTCLLLRRNYEQRIKYK